MERIHCQGAPYAWNGRHTEPGLSVEYASDPATEKQGLPEHEAAELNWEGRGTQPPAGIQYWQRSTSPGRCKGSVPSRSSVADLGHRKSASRRASDGQHGQDHACIHGPNNKIGRKPRGYCLQPGGRTDESETSTLCTTLLGKQVRSSKRSTNKPYLQGLIPHSFQSLFFSKTCRCPWVSGGFLERRMGKNGEGTPRISYSFWPSGLNYDWQGSNDTLSGSMRLFEAANHALLVDCNALPSKQ